MTPTGGSQSYVQCRATCSRLVESLGLVDQLPSRQVYLLRVRPDFVHCRQGFMLDDVLLSMLLLLLLSMLLLLLLSMLSSSEESFSCA